jgi:type II secretory pathway component PulK
VNTAPKQVLSALFYTLPAPAIDQIISQRPFTDLGQLTQKVPELAAATTKTKFGAYGIKSSYFEVTVATLFGRYQRTTLSLVQRSPGQGGGSSVLWHRQLLPTNITAATATPMENSDNVSGAKI